MAGIYIHIPFCKQACHYCNFHFSTSLRYKNEFIDALLKEIKLRKDYLGGEIIETIYFGGGTPSLLEIEDLRLQIDTVREVFKVSKEVEITIESNPDDIDDAQLEGWKQAGINRLSIGVQSFFDENLSAMNRAHNADQAVRSVQLAQRHGFRNITIDLIYGIPGLSDEQWKENVDQAIALNIPHLSCYALTVEPATALQKMIVQKKVENVIPEDQARQFLQLVNRLEEAGYEHYEISNFAKPGFQSRHNSSYWQGKKYLGLGPSAHSFNGASRQWNVANNALYIKALQNGRLDIEIETLTHSQQLNEYIMIALRTKEGIDLQKVEKEFGKKQVEYIQKQAEKYIKTNKIAAIGAILQLTREGKLFADGIAGDLFLTDYTDSHR